MRRALPLALLLAACGEKAAAPPRFPKALAAAAGPATAQTPPKAESLPGKTVPVWVQRAMVADEVLAALPAERRASSDEDATALARIDCRSESMGTYSDGVPAYRSACTVDVLDLRSGALSARRSFPGKAPPQAQSEGRFSAMTPPDYAAIALWLGQLPLK
jgi:hypothetical protein